MPRNRLFVNPIFVVAIVLGIAFAVTAFVYGVMTMRAIQFGPADTADPHSLMGWIDQWGIRLMGVELALLAVTTALAIWLDSYFESRRG
ncbi:MAG: hypothetical protein KDA63_14135 [Planctomycetales bacterium]|nr:hypothetical protein [Planctomycetales bacterium]